MHGRKKKDQEEERKLPPEEQEKQREKFKRLRNLLETSLQCRKTHDFSQASMELSEKLLVINPSLETLWNLRRENALSLINAGSESSLVVTQELEFNAKSLKSGNVKSHEAWAYRSWVLRVLAENGVNADLENELLLCKQLLTADERNFHCWNYRSLVSKLANKSVNDDISFANQLINVNFSNFSAWNLKLMSLGKMFDRIPPDYLSKELELVNNALFTEPDDQSAWMVYRWLIKHLKATPWDDNMEYREILTDQLSLCAELDELEDHQNKWVMLSMISLMDMLQDYGDDDAPFFDWSSDLIFEKLIALDPGHANYYRVMKAKHGA